VLFEWHALDHTPLRASYFTAHQPGHIFGPYRANSIAVDGDGNLLVSIRNTPAVYTIDHQTGDVLWTLGGKQSSFRMGAGTSTWGQHDAIAQPDGTLTVFDDRLEGRAAQRTTRGFLSARRLTARRPPPR
jgi:outer membrane protein assembly factor BamB